MPHWRRPSKYSQTVSILPANQCIQELHVALRSVTPFIRRSSLLHLPYTKLKLKLRPSCPVSTTSFHPSPSKPEISCRGDCQNHDWDNNVDHSSHADGNSGAPAPAPSSTSYFERFSVAWKDEVIIATVATNANVVVIVVVVTRRQSMRHTHLTSSFCSLFLPF